MWLTDVSVGVCAGGHLVHVGGLSLWCDWQTYQLEYDKHHLQQQLDQHLVDSDDIVNDTPERKVARWEETDSVCVSMCLFVHKFGANYVGN